MTEIVCVANQKGGVGKTTTAINLAASLAHKGKKILLIDLDPQGNATMGVGVEKSDQEQTVYQALLGMVDLNAVVKNTVIPNFKVVPSNRNLAAAELELADFERREYRLADAIKALKENFDFIFIDCPPALSLLTINAFSAANSVLIPMQCEYFALEGLTDLIDSIKRIQNQLNPNLRICGLLRVMFDRRASLSQQVSGQLEKHFYSVLFKTLIPRNIRLAEAPSFGQPAIIFDPQAQGTLAYLELATEFLKAK